MDNFCSWHFSFSCFWCLFLQDHLISSKFFVFAWFFVFVYPLLRAEELSEGARNKFLALSLKSSCERLCEVEFWEVLRLKMNEGVFDDVTLLCHRLTAN